MTNHFSDRSRPMFYFYPKFSPVDLVLFRSPGAGLANLLFVWARTELYAMQTGGQAIAPTWRNFKVGTLLRAERDNRFYSDLFVHRTPARAISDALRRLSAKRTITETEYLDTPQTDLPTLVNVEEIRDGFVPLEGHADYLRSRLTAMSRKRPGTMQGFLAVHIRCGDFGPAAETYVRNSRIEIDWYLAEVARLRGSLKPSRIVIFTDDTTQTVGRAFAGQTDVEFAAPANAIQDMLLMSRADHIVVSNSTFSLWAAFLGRGTVSARFGDLFHDYGLRSAPFLDRVR